MPDITSLLDRLADLKAQQDALSLEKQELIDSVIPQEVRVKLAEIDEEYEEKEAVVTLNIAALEEEVKAQVVTNGASVKGQYLQAVYAKPRVSWDNNILEGLMIVLPQIEKARKIGAPSVSIRRIG